MIRNLRMNKRELTILKWINKDILGEITFKLIQMSSKIKMKVLQIWLKSNFRT